MTRTIKYIVPWLLFALVVALVMSAFTRYDSAKRVAGQRDIPASLEVTSTADAKAKKDGKAADSKKVSTAKGSTKAATVLVLFDGLNFREQPTKSSQALRGLDKGERLRWLSTKNGWHKVRATDGTIGWVAAGADYTRLDKGR